MEQKEGWLAGSGGFDNSDGKFGDWQVVVKDKKLNIKNKKFFGKEKSPNSEIGAREK